MRSKILIISFVLSLPFWWIMNVLAGNLEDLFLINKISDNPGLLMAAVSRELVVDEAKSIRTMRELNRELLDFGAQSLISVEIDEQGRERVLFEKNAKEQKPIASLTKLMTADIVLENFQESEKVKISRKALAQDEDFGNFKAGEIFDRQNLLYSLLLESSNDAAYALTEAVGENAFVDLMNLEARYLGLKNTYFENPTGLDSEAQNTASNFSTAEDLVKLTIHFLKNPLARQIISTPKINIVSADGLFHHRAITTNEFLKPGSSFQVKGVVGGKTGQTLLAGGCLILVLSSSDNGLIINVILGSDDRFGEMKKLTDWLERTHKI